LALWTQQRFNTGNTPSYQGIGSLRSEVLFARATILFGNTSKSRGEKLSRKKLLVSLCLLVVVIVAVGLFLYYFSSYTMTFGDEEARVEVRAITYHPGDTVDLRVVCKKPIRVAIVNVGLNSSIKGLENVTLYSGGEPDWGDEIVYSAKKAWEYEVRLNIVLPSDLQIENKSAKVYFTVKVYYAYPWVGISGSFTVFHYTKFITVALDVEAPGQ